MSEGMDNRLIEMVSGLMGGWNCSLVQEGERVWMRRGCVQSLGGG